MLLQKHPILAENINLILGEIETQNTSKALLWSLYGTSIGTGKCRRHSRLGVINCHASVKFFMEIVLHKYVCFVLSFFLTGCFDGAVNVYCVLFVVFDVDFSIVEIRKD